MRSVKCGTRSGYNAHLRKKEAACDECKSANLAHVRKWTSENKERWQEINAQARRKYRAREEVHEARIAYGRAYIKTDAGRESSLRSMHRRRARKMGNGFGRYSTRDVLEAYGTDCHLCGEPIDLSTSGKPGSPGYHRGLQLDHLVPMAKGGPDTLENVRPTHAICNMRKGAR